jgi:hypothetical protein
MPVIPVNSVVDKKRIMGKNGGPWYPLPTTTTRKSIYKTDFFPQENEAF